MRYHDLQPSGTWQDTNQPPRPCRTASGLHGKVQGL